MQVMFDRWPPESKVEVFHIMSVSRTLELVCFIAQPFVPHPAQFTLYYSTHVVESVFFLSRIWIIQIGGVYQPTFFGVNLSCHQTTHCASWQKHKGSLKQRYRFDHLGLSKLLLHFECLTAQTGESSLGCQQIIARFLLSLVKWHLVSWGFSSLAGAWLVGYECAVLIQWSDCQSNIQHHTWT